MQRTLTVVLFAFFVFFAKASDAQIYSEVDTLGTTAVEGYAGDTVTVLFNLVNTFPVGGFQVRVTYDAMNFIPLVMRLGTRSSHFELFGSNLDEPGVASFYGTTWRPLEFPIMPGSGPVIEMDLAIANNAVPGIYYIEFEDSDTLSHQNALSNARGDTLFIPIFDGQTVTVQPLQSVDNDMNMPEGISLGANYPNPFNGETMITFTLETPSWVELSVVDMLGRTVASVFKGVADAGRSSVIWDGRDADGQNVTSGMYLYRLIDSRGHSITSKMTLLR